LEKNFKFRFSKINILRDQYNEKRHNPRIDNYISFYFLDKNYYVGRDIILKHYILFHKYYYIRRIDNDRFICK